MSGGSDTTGKKGSQAAGGGTRKPWGGRFSEATDPTVERFSASIHYDKILARHDIRGSKAQARMLGQTGLISSDDAEALVAGLDRVAKEIEEGTFPFDPALEDIHMNIESRLRTHLGAVAGKLHTGRSRNDQVATDLALYLREIGLATQRGLLSLRGVLLERARENVDTILPGYTHLQRAQPVRLAHQWLAHIETLGRDASRFRDGRARITRSPLGAGALAGSTLPLDREQTARELGFEGPTRNSMDTVASRDGALEYLANAAISMVHLSRLAEELVLWSSAEFGFIELADAYSTGSSLMPQKKNPDVPELVRGKSGRAIGNLVTLLTVLKGLPLTYNRDLQEDKEPLFDSAQTLLDSLEVMAGAIATLSVRQERMAEAASDPMLLATDLAEILVCAGVPFRDAHEVVGRIVGHCTREGVDLRSFSHAQMQEFHPAFEAGSDALLELERSLESRKLTGGTARVRVEAALAEIEAELVAERAQVEADEASVREELFREELSREELSREELSREELSREQHVRAWRCVEMAMSETWIRRLVAVLTILLIGGTMTACGRYGKPVRPLPTAAGQISPIRTLDGPSGTDLNRIGRSKTQESRVEFPDAGMIGADRIVNDSRRGARKT